jgi:cardiolipin synthase
MLGLSSLGSYLFILYVGFVVVLTVQILLDNKAPEVTITWLLAIYFLPYVGAAIYLLSGVNWKKKKIMKQLPEKTFRTYLGPILDQQKRFMQESWQSIDNDVAKTMNLALHSGNSIITLNNDVKLYHQGASFFDDLIEDLKGAKDTIHMEFFIYRSDELGRRIKDILLEKAKEGVTVRMLFDGVGCFNKMSWSFKRELRESPIEARYFLDPTNVLSGRLLNYCNHRKIVVIDGQIGYTGGMNVGLDYLNGGTRFPSWRDTHMRVTGESVRMLQGVFLSDWYNSGGGTIYDARYFPEPLGGEQRTPMQIVCSGPDSDWNSLKNLYFNLISNANERLFIESPYFIPDAAMMTALETAALSGVEVNIMITGLPDKLIPFWVAHTYFESLLEAGATIYLYRKGFYHPKVLIADDHIATVGSCNMDVRSFHLDYEINAFFYSEEISRQLVEQFYQDSAECTRITLEELQDMHLLKRLRNSLFRIIAPLL